MPKKIDIDEIIELFQVPPGGKARLRDFDSAWMGTRDMRELGKGEVKARAGAFLEDNRKRLAEAQELLYAGDVWSVLCVFQAMDAAGKDGTIKHVMSGVNPQGCQVFSFKQPSSEELDHNFLWRYAKATPERGRIGIFNRSYYEEVLVVRVHKQILAAQKLPDGKRGRAFWEARYEDINNFERHLARNGTLILKFFLNVSKDEQKRRFLARLDDPQKHWKFSSADVRERGFWDDYMQAYEEMLGATSTKWAPWYVVPADHKYVTRAIVGAILTDRIHGLGLEFPKVDDAKKKELAEARKLLESE